MFAPCRCSSATLQLLDLTRLSTGDLLPLLLALAAATHLQALSLAGTGLPDDYCPTLVLCTALKTLDMSQNPDVTAAGLRAMPGLQQLQRLNLAGCQAVRDDALPVLGRLQQLQELVLAGTSVTWQWSDDEDNEAAPADYTAGGHDGDEAVHENGGSNRTAGAHSSNVPQQQLQLQGTEQLASSSSSSSQRPRLWPQLQLLDLTNTQLTDSGCIQLAKQFAPGAAAAAGQCALGPGLRVLLAGSSSVKLGKQALAAVVRISSLQRLTLQVSEGHLLGVSSGQREWGETNRRGWGESTRNGGRERTKQR